MSALVQTFPRGLAKNTQRIAMLLGFKRGSALIVRYFSVIELAGGFEYFVTGAGEEIAVGRW